MTTTRAKTLKPRKADPQIAGWREHVELPELGAGPLVAKLDTGARSASLHAEKIEVYHGPDGKRVRFEVPADSTRAEVKACDMPLHDERRVKNSGGTAELRIVVETDIAIAGRRWRAQVTLSDRSDMGVPMLLGRATIRGHFIVHPGRSFLLTRKEQDRQMRRRLRHLGEAP